MSDFETPASWDDEDPPTREVWRDAEPDPRQPGARPPAAPRGGYRIRSDETWARARAAYAAGDTAEEVAFRFDLAVGSVKHRAGKENWRKSDQEDPAEQDPVDPRLDDGTCHIGADEGYAALAERALTQLRRAMAQGRGGAAASWMRVHDRLSARAEAEARRQEAEAAQARAEAARVAEVDRRSAERAAAGVRQALAAAASDDALSAEAQAEEDLIAAMAALAVRVSRADPRDDAEREACEAELARIKRLNRRFDAAAPSRRISDDSDLSASNLEAAPDDP